METTLRPATSDDFAFAWQLYRDLMEPLTIELLGAWRDDGQRAVVRAGLASGDARIVRLGDEEVGWLQARERDGTVELLQIYVSPRWQGQGIGTGLIEDLKRRGLPVALSVMRNNHGARALYERLGFRIAASSEWKHLMRWDPTTPATTSRRGDGADEGPD